MSRQQHWGWILIRRPPKAFTRQGKRPQRDEQGRQAGGGRGATHHHSSSRKRRRRDKEERRALPAAAWLACCRICASMPHPRLLPIFTTEQATVASASTTGEAGLLGSGVHGIYRAGGGSIDAPFPFAVCGVSFPFLCAYAPPPQRSRGKHTPTRTRVQDIRSSNISESSCSGVCANLGRARGEERGFI